MRLVERELFVPEGALCEVGGKGTRRKTISLWLLNFDIYTGVMFTDRGHVHWELSKGRTGIGSLLYCRG